MALKQEKTQSRKNILTDSKAQEAGPFELLVAVVMMGFVLIIGYQAIQIVSAQNCMQETDKVLEDFKTAIEMVINEGSEQKLALHLPTCAPKKDQLLYFKTEQDPGKCSKYCPTARPSCVLLYFENSEFSRIKCVSIAFYTTFSKDSGTCRSIENFTLIDVFAQDNIEEANWRFRNATASSSSGTPIICAFKECRMNESGC